MTRPDELVWNHAVENGDFDLASQIANSSTDTEKKDFKVSSATEEQKAILAAAAYWGIDYGSLPRHEP